MSKGVSNYKLFNEVKKNILLSVNRFTEPIIKVFHGYLVSERSTKSSAKPSLEEPTSSDALLVMNVTMILLQYFLQNMK